MLAPAKHKAYAAVTSAVISAVSLDCYDDFLSGDRTLAAKETPLDGTSMGEGFTKSCVARLFARHYTSVVSHE